MQNRFGRRIKNFNRSKEEKQTTTPVKGETVEALEMSDAERLSPQS